MLDGFQLKKGWNMAVTFLPKAGRCYGPTFDNYEINHTVSLSTRLLAVLSSRPGNWQSSLMADLSYTVLAIWSVIEALTSLNVNGMRHPTNMN